MTYCESLATFPQRGTPRDDLLRRLRITNYRGSVVIAFVVNKAAETCSRPTTLDSRRAVIAFVVNNTAETLAIAGVFYGRQDYEVLLQEP